MIFAIVIFCASKTCRFFRYCSSQPVSDFLTALVAVMILLQWKRKNLQNKKEQQSGCGTAFRNGNLPQPLWRAQKQNSCTGGRHVKTRKSDEKRLLIRRYYGIAF